MKNKISLPGRLLPIVLVFVVTSFFTARPLAAALDDDIADATDAGIEFLLKAIEAKQVETGEHDDKNMGKIALETYALVVAGVSVDHPIVKRNFDSLARMGLDKTYSVACYAFALDAAISQLQADAALASPSQKFRDNPAIGRAYRPRLEASVKAIIRMAQPDGGSWNYGAGGNRFDNSNTQFAVLGLGVGLKRHVPIPQKTWESIVLHHIKCQHKEGPPVSQRPEYYDEEERGEGKRDQIVLIDKKTGKKATKKEKEEEKRKKKSGSPTVVIPIRPTPEFGAEEIKFFSRGWEYQSGNKETWNMTCGGLSSMILAEQALRGRVGADLQNKINQSIRDGLGWLMTHWNVGGGGAWSYYGIYSLEKVADLGEVKKFAGHDWYQEVAAHLLSQQRQDGSWPGGNPVQVRWNTSFALLVMNRATYLITQGRSTAGKMAETFASPGVSKETSDKRNWVYIREYDREFHIPTILRQLKHRPSPKLAKILEMALTSYPKNMRGFLVWSLVQARDGQRNNRLKKFLTDQLLEITGEEHSESRLYEAWYRRWIDVQDIGTKMEDPGGKLEKFYANTKKSLPLKKKIIWAVGRTKNKNLAPLLIEDLLNTDPEIRQQAYETLSLVGISRNGPIPLYNSNAPEAVREQQIMEIRSWYAEGKSKG